MSLSNMIFMMKFDFNEDKIKQYSKVKIITIINNCCLVEDINTLERVWIMANYIYPLNYYDNGGCWVYSKIYDEIAKKQGLL
jgi:hypothetical protein